MLILPDWLRYSLEWSVIGLPLGIYLLLLGIWQYRLSSPVLVSGQRDLLGLLLGLSGFFLVGPPTWLVYRLRWRGDEWYWVGYGVYVALLLLLMRWLLRRQRRTQVIYGVNAADAQQALAELAKHLSPGELTPSAPVGHGEDTSAIPVHDDAPQGGIASSASWRIPRRIYWPQQHALLEVAISPWLRTATLRWLQGNEDWQRIVEQTLQRCLAEKEADRTLVPILFLLGAILLGLGVFHVLIWLLLWWLRP